MDLVPLHPRQPIERYAPSGFRIGGVIYHGSLLVLPDRTLMWSVTSAAGITGESLKPVIENGAVQILLIGLGRRITPLPSGLHLELRRAGIAVEGMDTGAACRTYNVLLAEDRQVAAALIPPG
jgi:uncharacterized protein